MTVRYSDGALNALLGEQGVEAGANGFKGVFKDCVIDVYSGGQPASANNAPSGTFLGRVTLNAGAFTEGVATNGLEFAPPAAKELSKILSDAWQMKGLAAGVAGWFRLRGNAVDNGSVSTTLPRVDGGVGTTAGDMLMSNVNIVVDAISTVDVFKVKLS